MIKWRWKKRKIFLTRFPLKVWPNARNFTTILGKNYFLNASAMRLKKESICYGIDSDAIRILAVSRDCVCTSAVRKVIPKMSSWYLFSSWKQRKFKRKSLRWRIKEKWKFSRNFLEKFHNFYSKISINITKIVSKYYAKFSQIVFPSAIL